MRYVYFVCNKTHGIDYRETDSCGLLSCKEEPNRLVLFVVECWYSHLTVLMMYSILTK